MPSNDVINKAFLSCKAQLARLVSRLVPPHEIEDIVQETYVRVCQFNSKAQILEPQALMVTTARNLALDYLKRAERKLCTEFDEALFEEVIGAGGYRDETFNLAVSNEEFGRFCEAVRMLPPQCRRAFVLKKVYGHTQGEIAKKLQISESTVEKHIARGLQLCIEHMQDKVSGQGVANRRTGKLASTRERGQ